MSDTKPIPQGFTLSMAFMDTLPVIFFSISTVVLSTRFSSLLFKIGALLVITAGAIKVSWKFVLALAKKDIPFLNKQMHYLMPAGFLLILLGLFIDHSKWSISAIMHHIFSFPSILFFLLGGIGMGMMTYFAKHLDGHDAHSNWIEQGTNAIAQFCIMLGIIF